MTDTIWREEPTVWVEEKQYRYETSHHILIVYKRTIERTWAYYCVQKSNHKRLWSESGYPNSDSAMIRAEERFKEENLA